MKLVEYAGMDALALADLVRRREILPSELARLALAAIERLNPALNAVIETYPERVDGADAPASEGRVFGGVPFLMKDMVCHEEGVTHELGSRLAKGMVTAHETDLAARFRAAGVTIIGRTNTPEFGCSVTTEPVLYGATRNPWNTTHSPGGSSGGSAAAVAAGVVPIAHANDGGGSIRIPASCCGLVGLKPSRNLNPVGPDTGLALGGLGVEHIVSRSVRDTAAMLDATAGPGIGEWYYTPRTAESFLAETLKPPGRLRIALNLTPWTAMPVDPEIAAAIEDVARLCGDLGHIVEPARFALDAEPLIDCNVVIWASYLAGFVDNVAAATGRTPSPETLEATTLKGYELGKRLSAPALVAALEHANTVSRVAGRFFEGYDLMLMPTCARTAPRLGVLDADDGRLRFDEWFMRMMGLAPFCQVFNLTGQPAISLPLATSADSMPIGAMFAAPLAGEPRLLRLAAQLEAARPWRGRHPSVFAG